MAITQEQIEHRIAVRDAHADKIVVEPGEYEEPVTLACHYPGCGQRKESGRDHWYPLVLADIDGWEVRRIAAAVEKHLTDIGFGLLPEDYR
jgi:hypothetical protein